MRRRQLGYPLRCTCSVCNKEFVGYRVTATYCSDACKQAAYRENRKARIEAARLQLRLQLPEGQDLVSQAEA